VLFLHGLGASSHYWDSLVARTSGYEAIAPDLLGFERSPKPRHAAYDVETHLQVLEPLLRPDTIVVGHSTGAMLAAALAAAPPVPLAGVVLIGLRPLTVLVGPLLIRELPPAVVADGARHTWRSYSRTLHRVVVDHRSAPDLAAASVEVCLVHGTADREAPIAYAREAAGAAAQAGGAVSLEEVDGDPHIAVRAPEPVAAVLQAFLARPTTKTDPPSHHLS
jgi:pimeloyl-ACP methyl ester carboxylesterase